MQNPELLEQLKASVKKGGEALERVCESFVIKQDSKYQNNERSPSGDSCADTDEEEEEWREGEAQLQTKEEEEMDLEGFSPGVGESLSEYNTPSPGSLVEGSLGDHTSTVLKSEDDMVADSTLLSNGSDVAVSSSGLSPSQNKREATDTNLDKDAGSTSSENIQVDNSPVMDSLGPQPVQVEMQTVTTSVTSSSDIVILDCSEDEEEADVVVID